MRKIISIIIATYNASSTLERCLISVIDQMTDECELIIIDGDSKDATLDIICKYKSKIAYTISEPDNGIYDAWNKGIKASNGEWIMFIGADDQLCKEAVKTYLDYINEKDVNNLHLISSRRKIFDLKGKEIRVVGARWSWPSCLKGMPISHPGALHHKDLFQKYGCYNDNFKIAGDYELLIRVGKDIKTAFINKITVNISEGGISDSIDGIKEHYKAIVHNHPGSRYTAFYNDVIIAIKFYIKKWFRLLGINLHL